MSGGERFGAFETRGEQYAGRSLQSENRAGVRHYVTGQHHATIPCRDVQDFFNPNVVGDVGRVSYVNVRGHAVVVLTWRDRGSDEWKATWVGSAGQFTETEAVRAPSDFKLSEAMLAALAEADKTTDDVSSSPGSESGLVDDTKTQSLRHGGTA